jgi:hypothetical protein
MTAPVGSATPQYHGSTPGYRATNSPRTSTNRRYAIEYYQYSIPRENAGSHYPNQEFPNVTKYVLFSYGRPTPETNTSTIACKNVRNMVFAQHAPLHGFGKNKFTAKGSNITIVHVSTIFIFSAKWRSWATGTERRFGQAPRPRAASVESGTLTASRSAG